MSDPQEQGFTFETPDDRPDKPPKPLHPTGTYVLRLADLFDTAPKLNTTTGKMVPRVMMIWLSNKVKDADGNPTWLLTTTNKNLYNGTNKSGERVGKATRLRLYLEALAGYPITEKEIVAGGDAYFIGKYALCTVSHYVNRTTRETGAQVENAVALPEGMEVDIPLDSYVRPPKLGGKARE